MRIALGADHAGVDLKEQVKTRLAQRSITYTDFGTMTHDSVDYPDIAAQVGREVASGSYDRGILICGTGLGVAIAANKIPGIRATPVVDPESARLSREHNDANVLTLGARISTPDDATRLVDIFLDTPFSGGRHQRRIDKLTALDQD